MIDVIIPAYNAHNTIYDTLYSISYQSISDLLNVYIVNDASVKDYSEIVDFFSNFINVKELKLDKNSGPGVARQYGIDNSNSEYIVFIDSDDVFSSTFSLSTLYKKIKNDNLDIVSFRVLSFSNYFDKISAMKDYRFYGFKNNLYISVNLYIFFFSFNYEPVESLSDQHIFAK